MLIQLAQPGPRRDRDGPSRTCSPVAASAATASRALDRGVRTRAAVRLRPRSPPAGVTHPQTGRRRPGGRTCGGPGGSGHPWFTGAPSHVRRGDSPSFITTTPVSDDAASPGLRNLAPCSGRVPARPPRRRGVRRATSAGGRPPRLQGGPRHGHRPPRPAEFSLVIGFRADDIEPLPTIPATDEPSSRPHSRTAWKHDRSGVLMEIMQNNSGNHSSTSYHGIRRFHGRRRRIPPGREEPTGELTGNRPWVRAGPRREGAKPARPAGRGAAGGGRSPWRPRRW